MTHEHTQVIGLDLGGTKLLGGSTVPGGGLGATHRLPTETGSAEALIGQIAALVAALHDARPLGHVVLGVPAAVDPASGLALAPNVPLAQIRDLPERLSARIGAPVTVENDVNLAAYAEAHHGAGQGMLSLGFLSLGTGIGLGAVLDGKILTGAHGQAGEIGSLPVGPASAPAQLEDLVGTPGILARYGGGETSVAGIFARADAGEPRAIAVLEETARLAAFGLASLQLVLDPSLIVIGGGIGTQPRFFALLQEAARALLPVRFSLAPAALGPEAGMLGALSLACRRAGLPPPLLG